MGSEEQKLLLLFIILTCTGPWCSISLIALLAFLPPAQSPSHEEGLLFENRSRRKFFKSLHHPVGLNCVDLVVEFRSNIYILESGSFGQKKKQFMDWLYIILFSYPYQWFFYWRHSLPRGSISPIYVSWPVNILNLTKKTWNTFL